MTRSSYYNNNYYYYYYYYYYFRSIRFGINYYIVFLILIIIIFQDCTSATKIKLICITPDIDISDTMIFTDDSISGERKRRDLTDQQVKQYG